MLETLLEEYGPATQPYFESLINFRLAGSFFFNQIRRNVDFTVVFIVIVMAGLTPTPTPTQTPAKKKILYNKFTWLIKEYSIN